MEDYSDTTYGERIAEIYDEHYADYDPASIELLAVLARGGPALELGIGTGRMALPLFEQGVSVQGIDASQAMIARLRAKPHGDEIEIITGSFAEFEIDQRFKLIYVVFNTFFALLTQEQQIQCLKSVHAHLAPEGLFLMEAFVPDPCRFTDFQTVRSYQLTGQIVSLEVSRYDPVTQQVTAQHVILSNDGAACFL